jgi:hypothetical protein
VPLAPIFHYCEKIFNKTERGNVSDEYEKKYIEHLKWWYGTDDLEEIQNIEHGMRLGLEEHYLEEMAEKIKSGVNVNKKDIAYCLRTFSLPVWPSKFDTQQHKKYSISTS